jgi:hypothetical protein
MQGHFVRERCPEVGLASLSVKSPDHAGSSDLAKAPIGMVFRLKIDVNHGSLPLLQRERTKNNSPPV